MVLMPIDEPEPPPENGSLVMAVVVAAAVEEDELGLPLLFAAATVLDALEDACDCLGVAELASAVEVGEPAAPFSVPKPILSLSKSKAV